MVVADGGGPDRTRGVGGRGRLWSLSVTLRRADRQAILLLNGRLWYSTVSELESAARPLLSEGVLDLVLDLSCVDYLSSAALEAIERLSRDLSAKGGCLTLRAPADPVRIVLELSGGLLAHIEPAGG
jgi:anti-anti-sigma factor